MIDWSSSYTAYWRVFRVHRKTWADGEELSRVDSVSISRNSDGSLLESGSMDLSGAFEPDYYRVVMIAEQGDARERVDVATLLFDATGGKINRGNTDIKVNGYSVLYPASVSAVSLGEYAPAGYDGVQYAKELLERTLNAPVETEGSFTLNEHIVHELGATVLNAVWSVLDAGGYVIQIDGRGVVHIRPKPSTPALIISGDTHGLMMNGIDYSQNMSDIPNRYVVITETNITTAENNDPNSPVSTVNRGYNVDVIDTAPAPVDGETYPQYANRMLKEMSILKDERSYVREYAPDVYPYSIVKGSIDGFDGDARVNSQSISCDNGITVSESVYKEIRLW